MIKVSSKEMSIWVEYPKHYNLTYPRDYLKLFVHSPNDLPMLDNGMEKVPKPRSYNVIQFNKIKIRRLDGKYDTKCTRYSHFRSICVRDCFQSKINEQCNTSGLVRSPFMLLRNDLDRFVNVSFVECVIYKKVRHATLIDCQSRCKNDCHQTYYSFTMDELYRFRAERLTRAEFKIKRNGAPDIHIRYLPNMNRTSFICNLGGLLGMWLGLSVIAITKEIGNLLIASGKKLPDTIINIHNTVKIKLGVVNNENNNIVKMFEMTRNLK